MSNIVTIDLDNIAHEINDILGSDYIPDVMQLIRRSTIEPDTSNWNPVYKDQIIEILESKDCVVAKLDMLIQQARAEERENCINTISIELDKYSVYNPSHTSQRVYYNHAIELLKAIESKGE